MSSMASPNKRAAPLPAREASVKELVSTLKRKVEQHRADGAHPLKAAASGGICHVRTEHEEVEAVRARHGSGSWQLRALKWIHSSPVQFFLMSLLLLDVVVLFCELFLDAEYPNCRIIKRDSISCCEPSYDGALNQTLGATAHRLMRQLTSELICVLGVRRRFRAHGAEEFSNACMHASVPSTSDEEHGAHGEHEICEPPLIAANDAAGCDEHKYDGVHTAHTALFSLSVSILALFECELLLLLCIVGPGLFFTNLFYLLDLFVVTSSLVLEVTIWALDDGLLGELIGVIVLVRCWRFVRIGHGLYATATEAAERRVEELLEHIGELERFIDENHPELSGAASRSAV